MTFIPPLLSDAVASGTKTLEKTFTFTIDALRRLCLTGLGDSAKKSRQFHIFCADFGWKSEEFIYSRYNVLFTAESFSFIRTRITVHGLKQRYLPTDISTKTI